MQVCVPSTPAQMFHMLRRQMLRHVPQAAHRHDAEEPAASQAVRVAARRSDATAASARRSTRSTTCTPARCAASCSAPARSISTCSRRGARTKLHDVAIVRIEQLYPFPADEYAAVARDAIRNAREIVWCQEEPQNQGAWYQIRHRLQEPLSREQRAAVRGPRAGRGAGDRHHAVARGPAAGARRGRAALDQRSKRRVARETSAPARDRREQEGSIMSIEVKSSATARVRRRRDAGRLAQASRARRCSRDENLVDLETDKVVLEVPAPVDGRDQGAQGRRTARP